MRSDFTKAEQGGGHAPSDVRPNRTPLVSFEAVPVLLPIVDLAIILGSSILSTVVVAAFYLPAAASSLTSLYGLALIASGIYVFRMRDINHYEANVVRRGGIEWRQMTQTWAISVIVLLAMIYLFKLGQLNTRRVFIGFVGLAFCGLVGWRAILKFSLRQAIDRSVIGRRNVLLIGEPEELQARDFEQLVDFYGIGSGARFAISGGEDGRLNAEDMRIVERAVEYARESNAEEAMVAMSWGHRTRLDDLCAELRALPLSARLLPDRQIRAVVSFPSGYFEHLLQVELQRAPLTLAERTTKRLIDVALAGLGLVVLSPVLAVVALLIRMESPGPVVFRQRRIGFNGQEFTIYKFRTMRVHEDDGSVTQATRGDARVTRLGRFLRAASIDELPQLLNVLSGEMSLVGPRPHALAHDYEFEKRLADYAFRRHVKPGITGWAQCNGSRGPTPTEADVRKRVELDLWYVTNWSIWLDAYILVKTIFVLPNQKNAL
jgi:Undecaprenyl-phosphate glucose phosphotransferase